ncbi:MAG TPA: SDR family oxidoreductase [Kiritimatiellia bacterium]|nr:SDR family oxidoreductase [Kiritimatiellia bacterium]
MIEKNATYVVMGLLDPDSIAFAIGQAIEHWGGKVIYTVQNERLKKVFLDRTDRLTQEQKDALRFEYCDVTVDQQVKELFEKTGPISGVVHSIAYANPKTCLGNEFHTDAYDDLKLAFHISCISLATVARYAAPQMKEGGSVVALSFESRIAFPYYNWMGVNKAALEALVRALARRHGRDLVRVNAISAGPLTTKAAKAIPHFAFLARTWRKMSPLPWDTINDKAEVANAVLFLLGPYSKKITGQIMHVDGGTSIIGGDLLSHEKMFEQHAESMVMGSEQDLS